MAADSDGDWERFREYLNFLARTQLDRRLQGKLDLSGVVQQTLHEAHRSAMQLRGQTHDEKAAWLRRILANNLADELRRLRANRRDVSRERSLEEALDQSSSCIEAWLAADQSSPSHQAMRHDEAVRVAEAVAALPEDQRRVVELHHFSGLSLVKIGAELGRTKGAVAGLLHRGLAKLREALRNEG